MEDVLMGANGTPFDPSTDGGVVAPQEVMDAANKAGNEEQSEMGGISPIVLLGAGVLAYFLFFKKGKKLF